MSAAEDGALPTCDSGPVAQWIRHLTTNQGIPGSSPGGVAQEGFPFNWDIVLCRRWLSDTARVVDELDMHACLNDRDQVSGALTFPKIALTMA